MPSISNYCWWYYFLGYEWNNWSTVLCVLFWSKSRLARCVDNSVILNLLCWNETLFSVKLIPKKYYISNQVPLFYKTWTLMGLKDSHLCLSLVHYYNNFIFSHSKTFICCIREDLSLGFWIVFSMTWILLFWVSYNRCLFHTF